MNEIKAKSSYCNPLMWVALCLLLNLLTGLGCSKIAVHQFDPKPVDTYQYRTMSEGLVIAVHPIVKRSEAEMYLGRDLLASDVLPLAIVAENRGGFSSYIISKDAIWIEPPNTTATETSVIGPELRSAGEVASALGHLGAVAALAAPGAAVLLPLQVVGMKMLADANEVEYQMTKNELQKKMISPGAKMWGFLYFRVPNSRSGTWTVNVKVLNTETQEHNVLPIQFKYSRD